MKLYAYSVRAYGLDNPQPYKRGPFADHGDWHQFLFTKHGRKMAAFHALIDEEPDPPVLHTNPYIPLDKLALPYPLLIRKYDGALITNKGTLVFEGGPR